MSKEIKRSTESLAWEGLGYVAAGLNAPLEAVAWAADMAATPLRKGAEACFIKSVESQLEFLQSEMQAELDAAMAAVPGKIKQNVNNRAATPAPAPAAAPRCDATA